MGRLFAEGSKKIPPSQRNEIFSQLIYIYHKPTPNDRNGTILIAQTLHFIDAQVVLDFRIE